MYYGSKSEVLNGYAYMTKKGKTISYYNNKYGGLSRRKTQQAAQTAAQTAAQNARERYNQARLDMSTLTRELITKTMR